MTDETQTTQPAATNVIGKPETQIPPQMVGAAGTLAGEIKKMPPVDGGAGLDGDGKPFAKADPEALLDKTAAFTTLEQHQDLENDHFELAGRVAAMEHGLASLAAHATSQEHDSLEGVKKWYTGFLAKVKNLV